MLTRHQANLLAMVFFAGALVACGKIPKDRYGIHRVRIHGAKDMDEYALEACLASQERASFELSTSDPECGIPPFDQNHIHLPLWSWSWTDWPTLDQAALEKDIDRVERWYRARGYYQAKVTRTRLTPASALRSDRVSAQTPCEHRSDEEGCVASIDITVREGKPVRIVKIRMKGIERLDLSIHHKLWESLETKLGERFDEAYYERSKQALARALSEASYARAQVTGTVHVDPRKRTVEVIYDMHLGPKCRIGSVTVAGQGEVPVGPIKAASLLRRGDRYRLSALEEAQGAIFGLGAFSSVSVEPQLEAASTRPDIVDIVIRVTPGRLVRFGFGGGVQSGTYFEGLEQQDVPQWDVHLLSFYEHRNLFGGLRRFRVEVRPRFIFNNVFPRLGDCCSQPFDDSKDPILGNLTTITFRQPAFLEPRTTLVLSGRWDLGPDPFFRDREFYRHDLDARIAPERFFFNGKLYVSMGLHGNLLRKFRNRDAVPVDYNLLFLEQQVRVDLRDRPQRTRQGAYFAATVHEAGFFMPSTWDYVRVVPEARGYLSLPYGMVLAARLELGMMFITGANLQNNDISNSLELGPFRYRLRGGGPNSHRGYLPGRLGDGPTTRGLDGGLRSWESSIELRTRITENFGITVFSDFGDVNPAPRFRFDYTNMAVGGGLRYHSFIGTVRFDMGYLVPGMGIVGKDDLPGGAAVDFGFVRFPGAMHFTLGEAF